MQPSPLSLAFVAFTAGATEGLLDNNRKGNSGHNAQPGLLAPASWEPPMPHVCYMLCTKHTPLNSASVAGMTK